MATDNLIDMYRGTDIRWDDIKDERIIFLVGDLDYANTPTYISKFMMINEYGYPNIRY